MDSTKAATLRRAVLDLQSRGLLFAAKWAAQQLNSLPPSPIGKQHGTRQQPPSQQQTLVSTADSFVSDDNYLLAKSYYDLREFGRCAAQLSSAPILNARSAFLSLYSEYLSISGNSCLTENGAAAIGSDTDALSHLSNSVLDGIRQFPEDGFLLYLYGVLMSKQRLLSKALSAFIQSIQKYPFNWSAWLELINCVKNAEDIRTILPQLPGGFMKELFELHYLIEMNKEDEKVEMLLEDLDNQFPRSNYLLAQRGTYFYNMRQFDLAEQILASLHARDPNTVDYMDIYSNTLFVNENRKQLGILAHKCSKINRYRPETHLIIGNYYSIRGLHEKAISSFQRALKLDKSYLSAWTLMGHEYLELGNTYAALEAYRRAIDVNPKDYRAWFGLGQTYEMLRMTFYSLHYYQRAAALRSNDPRMWSALSQVYESLELIEEAILCLTHATQHCIDTLSRNDAGNEDELMEDRFTGADRMALLRLGKLYARKQDVERCVFHYTVALRNWESEERGPAFVDAVSYLARYHKERGNRKLAERFVQFMLETNGPEKEEAKVLLRELRSGETFQ